MNNYSLLRLRDLVKQDKEVAALLTAPAWWTGRCTEYLTAVLFSSSTAPPPSNLWCSVATASASASAAPIDKRSVIEHLKETSRRLLFYVLDLDSPTTGDFVLPDGLSIDLCRYFTCRAALAARALLLTAQARDNPGVPQSAEQSMGSPLGADARHAVDPYWTPTSSSRLVFTDSDSRPTYMLAWDDYDLNPDKFDASSRDPGGISRPLSFAFPPKTSKPPKTALCLLCKQEHFIGKDFTEVKANPGLYGMEAGDLVVEVQDDNKKPLLLPFPFNPATASCPWRCMGCCAGTPDAPGDPFLPHTHPSALAAAAQHYAAVGAAAGGGGQGPQPQPQRSQVGAQLQPQRPRRRRHGAPGGGLHQHCLLRASLPCSWLRNLTARTLLSPLPLLLQCSFTSPALTTFAGNWRAR